MKTQTKTSDDHVIRSLEAALAAAKAGDLVDLILSSDTRKGQTLQNSLCLYGDPRALAGVAEALHRYASESLCGDLFPRKT